MWCTIVLMIKYNTMTKKKNTVVEESQALKTIGMGTPNTQRE